MIRLKNSLFDSQPIVAHCPGPLHGGWNTFAYSALHAIVAPRSLRDDTAIITWHGPNRPTKPNGLLERCAARFGVDVQVLRSSGPKWTNACKLAMTAEALAKCDREFVVGLDSCDVLLTEHPNEIVERFRERFRCELLYNATGSDCWPDLPEFAMFESERPGASEAQGRCWLNTGAFVGRVEYCRTYFAELARLAVHRGLVSD